MSARGRLAMVAVLFAAATQGCFVPTYEELEQERRRECDAAHPCSEGRVCLEGTCQVPPAGECQPNATEPCGNDEGACIAGNRTCGADGKWGPCIGEVLGTGELCNGIDDDCDGATDEEVKGVACGLAVGVCAGAKARCLGGAFETTCAPEAYGPLYELVETKCDGQDNDCNGSTDESLRQDCPKQLGVCADSNVACAMGAFAECTDATYASFAPEYETFEKTCDGKDNDCDGLADDWALENVSASMASSGNAAVVSTATGGLVMYEDGPTIVARAIQPDAKLAGAVTPSATLQFAARGFSPSMATNGAATYAAWVEELSNGGFRVLATTVDATGRSTLTDGTGSPSASPVYACLGTGDPCSKPTDCCSNQCGGNTCTGTPTRSISRVKVAASTNRLLFLITESGASASLLAIGWPASPIPPSSSSTFVRTFGGSDVRADARARSQNGFVVAYEQGNDIEVRTLDGSGSLGTAPGIGGGSLKYPVLGPALPGGEYRLYAFNPAQQSIELRGCTLTNCPTLETVATGLDASVGNLSLTEVGASVYLAWDEQTSHSAFFVDVGSATFPAVARKLNGVGVEAGRPAVLPAGELLFGFFDNQGKSGAPADEVLLQRFCAP